MTTLYISSLLTVLLLSAGAVWMIHHAYKKQIEGLWADNKDLRDRLFQKNNIPPSGVDLTEKYVARQEAEAEAKKTRQENPSKGLGPIEALTNKFKADDLRKAERGIDATRGRIN